MIRGRRSGKHALVRAALRKQCACRCAHAALCWRGVLLPSQGVGWQCCNGRSRVCAERCGCCSDRRNTELHRQSHQQTCCRAALLSCAAAACNVTWLNVTGQAAVLAACQAMILGRGMSQPEARCVRCKQVAQLNWHDVWASCIALVCPSTSHWPRGRLKIKLNAALLS